MSPLRWFIPLVYIPCTLFALTAPVGGQCVEPCVVIHDLDGEAQGDQFGWVSNDVFDVDGDGVHDFIITAPTNDGGGNNAGRVYVYSGATGAELYRVTGAFVNGWLGHDAQAAGFIDADTVPDIIIGAPFNGPGRAVVLSGADGSELTTLTGEAAGDQFGFASAGGGDFDGDGTDDLLITAVAHNNTGRAYIYSGVDFSLICSIDGAEAGDLFGSSAAFIGDTDSPPDGRDDVVIAAQNGGTGNTGNAGIYKWNGTSCELRHPLTPPAPVGNFGQFFSNGGFDMDGDNTPDVYVSDFPANRAHVFSGRTGLVIRSFQGDNNGQFGIGRMVPDLNGDGLADMVLAAWISNEGANQAGKGFIYSGGDGALIETFTHDAAGGQLGFDANGVGDVNGDGKDDYLFTAVGTNVNRGRALVFAGQIPPPPANDACVTAALANPGDTPFTLLGATTDGFPETCGDFERDIWYRVVATCGEVLTASISDADIDIELALYSFACPGEPNAALDCSAATVGGTAAVSIPVPDPGLFRVRIGSSARSPGRGTLVITCGPADLCPADCAPPPDGNGQVNVDDLFAVVNAISNQDLQCDIAPDNGDGTFGNGVVNFDDLIGVINAFGACP